MRGKTGEAEFAGGSHSWFAGYRGDMAFAALIVGGGSSEYAVRMLKGMFDGLPPDYLAIGSDHRRAITATARGLPSATWRRYRGYSMTGYQ